MNQPSQHPKTDAQLVEELRAILLSQDREALQQLRDILENEEQLALRVAPIIQQHLTFIKENFASEYGTFIQDMVNQQLAASQDQIINIIYPKLNTIIKKFITAQFQMLKESIDAQLNKVKYNFSPKNIFNRFFGSSKSDIILSQLDQPEIHEIYVIQRNSGLLLGSYSKEVNIDQDVIAGMFTAIKSFAEDAFNRDGEDLENIQYENYRILIQNLPTYYFAVALTGSLSASEKSEFSNKLLTFADESIPFDLNEVTGDLTAQISKDLKNRFAD